MIVIGDRNYQLNLSRLAYFFKGAVSMDSLQDASTHRVRELVNHSKVISEELNRGQ